MLVRCLIGCKQRPPDMLPIILYALDLSPVLGQAAIPNKTFFQQCTPYFIFLARSHIRSISHLSSNVMSHRVFSSVPFNYAFGVSVRPGTSGFTSVTILIRSSTTLSPDFPPASLMAFICSSASLRASSSAFLLPLVYYSRGGVLVMSCVSVLLLL